jgi:predicted HTH transcriptional regulator
MAKPQKKIFQIVALIEANGPISANRLTEITDDWRQTIDMYIRKAHKLGLIHIADFGQRD